jgi:hypothetical protein
MKYLLKILAIVMMYLILQQIVYRVLIAIAIRYNIEMYLMTMTVTLLITHIMIRVIFYVDRCVVCHRKLTVEDRQFLTLNACIMHRICLECSNKLVDVLNEKRNEIHPISEYCDSCDDLSLTEEDQDKQSNFKDFHICKKYCKRVKHLDRHPKILKLIECLRNEPRRQ